MKSSYPVVIVGTGLAGLATALAVAPMPVLLVARRRPGDNTSSEMAQGGIAAAIGDDDNPMLHAKDTLLAGAGLCSEQAVRAITQAAPNAIARLVEWGVPFDRDHNNRDKLALGLEGAHSRRRIVHAGGDSTGGIVVRSLIQRVLRTPSITICEGSVVRQIITDDNGVCGLLIAKEYGDDGYNNTEFVYTRNVVLATGGAGALWKYTTNYATSCGSGIAMARRIGAKLRDLEFVQFHPTAIMTNSDPLPLASEALRGEGARLVNDMGVTFMQAVAGGELAPRDVVARCINTEITNGRKVFLDCTGIANFADRFPTVASLCDGAGIDPSTQPVPIIPAAHYHMGGISADINGRTTVPGLWACGEVACTGLHGANRLASNSLLEAAVMGINCAAALISEAPPIDEPHNLHIPEPSRIKLPPLMNTADKMMLRTLMSRNVGIIRSSDLLAEALDNPLLKGDSECSLVAREIAQAALARSESCGSHVVQ